MQPHVLYQNVADSQRHNLFSTIPHMSQATTPIDPRVLDKMLPYQVGVYGNPHSRTHAYGWESETAVDDARAQVAELIGKERSKKSHFLIFLRLF